MSLKPFFKKHKPKLIGFAVWASIILSFQYANAQRNIKTYLVNPIVYISEEEFQRDLKIKKKRLGLENTIISCKDDADIYGGHCFKNEGGYLLRFNPKYKTPQALSHELYHVKKWEEGFLGELLNALSWGQYEEWQATSYAIADNPPKN